MVDLGWSNAPYRDSLTDMSLLMYSCKAGASGVGNVGSSVKIVNYLVELGCDLQVLGYLSYILKQDFEHIWQTVTVEPVNWNFFVCLTFYFTSLSELIKVSSKIPIFRPDAGGLTWQLFIMQLTLMLPLFLPFCCTRPKVVMNKTLDW